MACDCSGRYLSGETVDVAFTFQDTGTGLPVVMTTVLIYATPPSGSSVPLSVSIPSPGRYTASFTPVVVGRWRAVAIGTKDGKTRELELDIPVDPLHVVP